jgi:hypothetical protein
VRPEEQTVLNDFEATADGFWVGCAVLKQQRYEFARKKPMDWLPSHSGIQEPRTNSLPVKDSLF